MRPECEPGLWRILGVSSQDVHFRTSLRLYTQSIFRDRVHGRRIFRKIDEVLVLSRCLIALPTSSLTGHWYAPCEESNCGNWVPFPDGRLWIMASSGPAGRGPPLL